MPTWRAPIPAAISSIYPTAVNTPPVVAIRAIVSAITSIIAGVITNYIMTAIPIPMRSNPYLVIRIIIYDATFYSVVANAAHLALAVLVGDDRAAVLRSAYGERSGVIVGEDGNAARLKRGKQNDEEEAFH